MHVLLMFGLLTTKAFICAFVFADMQKAIFLTTQLNCQVLNRLLNETNA